MKSKQEFVERFEELLAGFGLWGVWLDSQQAETKTLAHAARAMKVPDKARRMLGVMYDFLMAEQLKPQPPANGRAAQTEKK